MNPISHAQARRLIQAQFDERSLPEAQWTALHAHLEGCAECRAYRERFSAAERATRRTLRARWDGVDGPVEATAPALVELVRERKAVRRVGGRLLGGAGAFLLVAILFVAWSANLLRGGAAPAPTSTPEPLTPAPSPTPTRAPGDFQGVVLYETREGAGSPGDILLWNAGSDPVALVSGPSDDYAPAWSPDGNWVAFLSDRSGKDEVWVVNISGTRLTRLTDLPNVSWRGPISWSSDGKLLALTGERAVGEKTDTWVFLVPLDGSNAYTLGYSSGAAGAAFSPAPEHRWLAFVSKTYWNSGLVVYNMDPNVDSFQPAEPTYDSMTAGQVRTSGLFEWSADGSRLLYRVDVTGAQDSSGSTVDRTELRAVSVSEDVAGYQLTSRVVASYAPPGSYPQLSWTGIKDEFAYLTPADSTGCQSLRLGFTNVSRVIEVPDLCVQDGLERGNWRTSEKSVLVRGWTPGRPTEPGLFAVRFQNSVTGAGLAVKVDWLASAQNIAGPPRVRPTAAAPLAINPMPVRALVENQPSPLPGPETGDLLVTSTLNERTLIERLDPASPRRTLINQSVGQNQCLTWSPGRDRIAFLSDRDSDPGITEVYVMDAYGQNTRRLTEPVFTQRSMMEYGTTYPMYGCPIWSPDGKWLAASIYTPSIYAAVIPLDPEDGAPRYLPPPAGMYPASLAWLPDGRLLVSYSMNTGEGIILRAFFPLDIEDRVQSTGEELYASSEWSSATVAPSPDGKYVALSVIHYRQNANPLFSLLIADWTPAGQTVTGPVTERFYVRYRFDLTGQLGYYGTEGLRWLPDGRLAYLLRYPAGRQIKTELFTLSARAWQEGVGFPERVAAFKETVLASAWSADGRWLTVTTEAGRYTLDVSLAPNVAPAWVDGESGHELSW